jgi:UPF0271 protein
MLSPLRVDLNADLGESTSGSAPDAALMTTITSANVACGLHAGGPALMRATVRLAREHAVAVGAHPSLDDRSGFGRRELAVIPLEVENLVAYQVGALAGIAAQEGVRLRHVKPHGALYNMAARDRALAEAIVRALLAIDRALVLVGLSGSHLLTAAREAGLRAAGEAFADRAYAPDGSLVPRRETGAVIDDPDVAAARAVAMVVDRVVLAADGTPVPLYADTICLHGDTPGAAAMAVAVRRALERAGVTVAPLGGR